MGIGEKSTPVLQKCTWKGDWIQWDDAQIFLAVARYGSFSSAAKRLGVRHSTVSRRIRALEKC